MCHSVSRHNHPPWKLSKPQVATKGYDQNHMEPALPILPYIHTSQKKISSPPPIQACISFPVFPFRAYIPAHLPHRIRSNTAVDRVGLPPISGSIEDTVIISVHLEAVEIVTCGATNGSTVRLICIRINSSFEDIPVTEGCYIPSISLAC